MASGVGSKRKQRRSSQDGRPNMSEWRIIVLGKNLTENSSVGEFIRTVFESEGRKKERYITIIKTPDLLNPNFSLRHISRGVRKSLPQSAPGPHAFILVLQHNDFTEEDKYRVKSVLKEFSKQAIKYTTVVTTDDAIRYRFRPRNKAIYELIKECGERHIQSDDIREKWRSTVEQIIKEHNEEGVRIRVDEKSSKSEDSKSEEEDEDSNKSLSIIGPYWGSTEQTPGCDQPKSVSFFGGKKLNLVLCGSDRTLKSSISNLLRGTKEQSVTSGISKVCVKKKGNVNGRQITVVELPSFSSTQLSEDEVIHESLRSVSLCDPGVHVFLIVIPVGPLTDEDRTEIRMIQRIFASKEHFMVIYYSVEAGGTDFIKHSTESERLFCGCWYRVLVLKEYEISKHILELLDYIENNKTKSYSLQMYMKRVRRELEEKHKAEIIEKENEIKELQCKIQSEGDSEGDEDSGCLRVVLIGKTGNGKSETGNTILGRKQFNTEVSVDSVTTVCMKAVGEVQGKSIAVVDTPGLFDTKLSNEQVQEEIVKCISLSAPGPHVFIIVLSVGRFTKEEMETVHLIKMIFGSKAAQFSIVLFTRGDSLENQTIEEYIEKSKNAELKKLIRDCENRVLVFNNKKKQDSTQLTKLLKTIEDVKKSNHGQYFTNKMLQEAEMSVKKRLEEILKEKEKKNQFQNKELIEKYQTDMVNMMERLEEEKRKADEERLLMESKFREKEETLRKEFEEKDKSEQKIREMEDQKRSEEDKQQKAEYDQKFEEMRQQIEKQRLQYQKQQKVREEEDKRREKKYKQDLENLKNDHECAIEKLIKKREEEVKKSDLEERKRIKEEEEERQRWKNKIKDAENDRKEIQEDIKRQQREWEEKMKLQMKEREEEERRRKDRHIAQLIEKQHDLEGLRDRFEREIEEERQKRKEERQRWRDIERKKKEQKEREYEEMKNEMKRKYEQLERGRKAEWEKRKQEDDERREEERKRLEKMIKDLKQEQEEEIGRRETEERARKEKEEKERDEMKQKHDEEMEKMKKKHEDEARKHAEEFNEFRDKKEQHIQELRQMLEERQKENEILQNLYKRFLKETSEEENIHEEETEKGKKKENCVIM